MNIEVDDVSSAQSASKLILPGIEEALPVRCWRFARLGFDTKTPPSINMSSLDYLHQAKKNKLADINGMNKD